MVHKTRMIDTQLVRALRLSNNESVEKDLEIVFTSVKSSNRQFLERLLLKRLRIVKEKEENTKTPAQVLKELTKIISWNHA